MIQFTISGETYKIDSLKIKHYYKVQDIFHLDKNESKLSFVSIVSGCDEEILKKLNKYEFGTIWDAVEQMFIFDGEHKEFYQTIHLN